MLKFCNPAREQCQGRVLQPPSLFSGARVKAALTTNTSAKSEEPFQGATSETCHWMHFYINPEIFMLFVKYSCVPVCKLVPGGKMQRNWGDPIQSANKMLSFANVASIQDIWRGTNDLSCQGEQQSGASLVRQPTSIWLFLHSVAALYSYPLKKRKNTNSYHELHLKRILKYHLLILDLGLLNETGF